MYLLFNVAVVVLETRADVKIASFVSINKNSLQLILVAEYFEYIYSQALHNTANITLRQKKLAAFEAESQTCKRTKNKLIPGLYQFLVFYDDFVFFLLI